MEKSREESPAETRAEEDPTSRHRGHHPADPELFAEARIPVLRTAVAELSWLLERGYNDSSALALVGNRHELRKRQRKAVLRCSCGDTAREERQARKLRPGDLAGRAVAIDGFNCVIGLEAALSGAVVLVGRDSAHRDMSSVHGSYRRVSETRRALALVADFLAACEVESVSWLLDRPVSNSGRLKALIAAAAPPDIPWTIELVYNPDRELCEQHAEEVVVTGDAWVLDHCGSWVDLAGEIIRQHIADAWRVDLGACRA